LDCLRTLHRDIDQVACVENVHTDQRALCWKVNYTQDSFNPGSNKWQANTSFALIICS